MQTSADMNHASRACSICLHLMHDVFGARTEELMHELYASSEAALRAASGIQASLDGLDSSLSGLDTAMAGLQQQQAAAGELGRETLQRAGSIQSAVAGIGGSLRSVQAAGVRLLGALPCSCPKC